MPLHTSHPAHPNILLSAAPSLLSLPSIHSALRAQYWSRNIPLSVLSTSISNSLCLGLYDTSPPPSASIPDSAAGKPRQIGFCRWVTDYACFGWLSDVYVLDEYRGKGLGKWMVEQATALEELKGCRRLMLMTRDAEELYIALGWRLVEPERGGVKVLEVTRDLGELYGNGDGHRSPGEGSM